MERLDGAYKTFPTFCFLFKWIHFILFSHKVTDNDEAKGFWSVNLFKIKDWNIPFPESLCAWLSSVAIISEGAHLSAPGPSGEEQDRPVKHIWTVRDEGFGQTADRVTLLSAGAPGQVKSHGLRKPRLDPAELNSSVRVSAFGLERRSFKMHWKPFALGVVDEVRNSWPGESERFCMCCRLDTGRRASKILVRYLFERFTFLYCMLVLPPRHSDAFCGTVGLVNPTWAL